MDGHSESIMRPRSLRYQAAELLGLRDTGPQLWNEFRLNQDAAGWSLFLYHLLATLTARDSACLIRNKAVRLRAQRLQDRSPALNPSTGDIIERTRESANNSSEETQATYSSQRSRLIKPSRWRLHRRDVTSSSEQPLSAPESKCLQVSENFRKFYKAVVTPTHVRVTAGGRIVPNYRMTPQFRAETSELLSDQSTVSISESRNRDSL